MKHEGLKAKFTILASFLGEVHIIPSTSIMPHMQRAMEL